MLYHCTISLAQKDENFVNSFFNFSQTLNHKTKSQTPFLDIASIIFSSIFNFFKFEYSEILFPRGSESETKEGNCLGFVAVSAAQY